jgi:diadenosine tetraphosphate (Ap4A) HIT family hydrolase
LFYIDERIQSSSFFLGDWPISQVFLKNEANYPWFILVPKKENIQEIHQLAKEERALLMEEIHQLSLIVKDNFKTDKLNIGALGNVVSQLHIHVIARNKEDFLWPQGLWQSSMHSTSYAESKLTILLPMLQGLIKTKEKELIK